MNNPTFRTAYRCHDCGEESFYTNDPEAWRATHVEKHHAGRCPRCGHWREIHRLTTEADRAYLRTDQRRCCHAPLGMGDFCGCAGDELEPGQ